MSKTKKIIPQAKNKLTSYDYHEALDRMYLMASTVNNALSGHPVILKHDELFNRVENAIELLAEAYQIIGGLECTLFPEEFAIIDEKLNTNPKD